MTSASIPRIAQAAAVITEVVGCDFEWETPGDRQYGRGETMRRTGCRTRRGQSDQQNRR
jgi:hypothetical protein